MWSAANSLSCAERSPIMTAAPGSISSDQRLSIVRSCGKHKAVRSQNRSIIDLVRFIYQSPPGWHGPLMGLSGRSEEHTSELQSRLHLVCRLLLEKKKERFSKYTLYV